MKNILIVEDELLIAMDLKEILENYGFNVCNIAITAEEAVDSLGKNSPDIILLDVFLKGKTNGMQLAELIKKEFRIPFYFVTANTDKSVYEKLIKLGARGIISKPFDEKRLLENLTLDACES